MCPKPVSKKGFTLIEVMVVISIIGILAVVIGVNSIGSSQQSRDAERQGNLRALQGAVELYKNKYGRYPAGCRGPNQWSGQQGTNYACSGNDTQYITGHAADISFAPEFIPVLPQDKKLNATSPATSGYVYRTNENGTVYKIMAMNTVESEAVDYNHPLESCHIIPTASGGIHNGASLDEIDIMGWCTRATRLALEPSGSPPTSIVPIPQCRKTTDGGNGRFERSYAVWGGFEAEATGINRASEVRNTTAVICK